MATYDLRNKTNASTGQRISLSHDQIRLTRLESGWKKLQNLEIKLDKILNLLENKKDKKNG